MNFNLKNHKKDLLFLPLGGAGEIGMNFNLYYYRGKWLIVDCGSGFAEDYLPGVDMIIPDISYLMQHKKDILGMVLTHAHEDHIGGVQYLWEELECPIYTTPFTSTFLKNRLKELKMGLCNEIVEIPHAGQLTLGGFDIQMVPLSHSTPEMQALLITTDVGKIFHTGDWKFDPNPVVGDVNDEKLLKKYGDEGVLAVIGDSTNVFNEEYSGSEGELKKSLIEIISKCKNMVVVATFASNVGRLEALIEAAHKTGRKVATSGRSLKRIMAAAKETGYLQNAGDIIDDQDVGSYERNKILVIATGCQGEPLAAVTKMSNKTHPRMKLRSRDTVIFSSKIIPGNDKKIYRVFNNLIKLGVEVLTEKDHFVHVSGHPGRKELRRLYALLKPHSVIPVHGEHMHMHEHAKIAKSCGVKNTVEIENGDVVKISPKSVAKVGRVEAGELAVYGNYFLSPNSEIMRSKRKVQYDGIFVVSMIISDKLHLAAPPMICAVGYLDEYEDKDLLTYIQDEVYELLEEHRYTIKKKKVEASREVLIKLAKSRIKSILKKEVGKIPIIKVQIERAFV